MGDQRIVATAPIGTTAIEILQQVAPVVTSPTPDEQTVLTLLDNAIGLVVRGEGRASRRTIEAAPALRVIGRTGAGYDAVDVEAATERHIPVVFAPVGGFAVAEGALALLLTLIKRIPECDQVVRSGQWQKRYNMNTGDMTGSTLGIIGLGRIGAHLARLVRPFDAIILAYDPYLKSVPQGLDFVELVSVDELFARSDYISLHVPLTDETKGLINRDRIARMKGGAIIVNTARGGLIESPDVLAEALENGQIGGVGLDVFPGEPPDPGHRIFRDRRLVCAPHLLGVSKLAMERIYRSMASDMVAVLRGKKPKFCVNGQVCPLHRG